MSRTTRLRLLTAVLAAASLTACGTATTVAQDGEPPTAGSSAPPTAAQDGKPPTAGSSVRPFVTLAARGTKVLFAPLASPRDAVAKADLVVLGTLVDVLDGVAVSSPNPSDIARFTGNFATFVVEVEKVIAGDAANVHQRRVYLLISRPPWLPVAELAAANPKPSVVAILDDVTTWRPTPETQVIRPPPMAADAPLYCPYSDGLWLQASGDATMHGLWSQSDQLAPAWGRPRTVQQLEAALAAATG